MKSVDAQRGSLQKAKPPEGLAAVRGLFLVRSALCGPRLSSADLKFHAITQPVIACAVSPALTAAFTRTVSPERWRTYLRAAGFKEELAHRLYVWNAAVGQSFHFPLQALEVALRNVVHQAIATVHGPDWPIDQACRNVLRPKQVDYITKAERRHYSISNQNATTPQIIASLSLGFWVAMLRREYNRSIWATQAATAFPHLPQHMTIADVSRTATGVQDLRNRIFHQEPLLGHNLTQDYGNVTRMLGWICAETRDWMKVYSSVPTVIRERPR